MTAALARLCDAHPGQNGVQLLDDGPTALAVRIALVRRAQASIDVQYYIWRDDVAGRLLLDELAAAAQRGVKVRLLLDDFGCAAVEHLVWALPGLEVRLFNPARLRWPRWPNALFDFARLNRRMHNKSLTVDGIATVIGGRNIGDEYFDAGHVELAADLDAVAIGAIAGEVAADFQRYWDCPEAVPLGRLVRSGAKPLPPAPPADRRATYMAAAASPATLALLDETQDFEWAPVRMLSDPPEKISGTVAEAELMLPRLLATMASARLRLLLVSAYFVPTRASKALLCDLAGQGVQVDVLTNSLLSNNVVLVHAFYAPWRKRLLAAGVRLWEMRGAEGERATLGLIPRRLRRRRPATSFFRASAGELHAKTYVADGRWLFVGSMNVDPRSWRLNTEMGFVIDSPRLASTLEAALDAGLPRFAWALELHEGQLGWREDDHLIQPEPGTTTLQRLALRLLGLFPLAGLF
jgi:putative cardiolipin synthase